ncbi:MAG: hypothetical protein K2N60_09025, partial [Oscillospiraceae bacterium]|nr:hypothetical protein [Oscillospiraceae bacterium]
SIKEKPPDRISGIPETLQRFLPMTFSVDRFQMYFVFSEKNAKQSSCCISRSPHENGRGGGIRFAEDSPCHYCNGSKHQEQHKQAFFDLARLLLNK